METGSDDNMLSALVCVLDCVDGAGVLRVRLMIVRGRTVYVRKLRWKTWRAEREDSMLAVASSSTSYKWCRRRR